MTTSLVVPRHAQGLTLEQDPRGARLVHQTRAALTLDATALALWELCDGDTTVEEMSLALGALFDAELEKIKHDIDAVLAAFAAAGAIDWVPARRSSQTTSPVTHVAQRAAEDEGDG